jgi:hypothetical protein
MFTVLRIIYAERGQKLKLDILFYFIGFNKLEIVSFNMINRSKENIRNENALPLNNRILRMFSGYHKQLVLYFQFHIFLINFAWIETSPFL